MKLRPVLPTLQPRTLSPRPTPPAALPFPLDRPKLQLWYLGRNAIHAALGSMGLLPGETVLVPSYTNGVEVAAIVARGLTVATVKVQRDFTLDLADLETQLRVTKAKLVLAIHYLGFTQPVDEILAICRRHGARLFEDCALSFLAKLPDGRPAGSVGDLAIYSLYKTLPVPDGAALVINDPAIPLPPLPREPDRASSLSGLGRLVLNGARAGGAPSRALSRVLDGARRAAAAAFSRAGVERTAAGSMKFETRRLPWGASRITRAILPRLDYDAIVAARRRNFLRLRERLDGIPTFFEKLPPGACPLFYPLIVADKPRLMEGLTRAGIESVNFWSTWHPATPPSDPWIHFLRAHVVEIPCLQDLDLDGIDYIADEVLALVTPSRIHPPPTSEPPAATAV